MNNCCSFASSQEKTLKCALPCSATRLSAAYSVLICQPNCCSKSARYLAIHRVKISLSPPRELPQNGLVANDLDNRQIDCLIPMGYSFGIFDITLVIQSPGNSDVHRYVRAAPGIDLVRWWSDLALGLTWSRWVFSKKRAYSAFKIRVIRFDIWCQWDAAVHLGYIRLDVVSRLIGGQPKPGGCHP